jgi:tetraacyldisaccharide 4'-kinase
MKWLRILLFPIVPIYFGVTWFRNVLFDLGVKSSTAFSTPVICVGNLSVGGTGKTPMIEYLIRLLNKEYRVATLSRGYKRKTEGFQLAHPNVTTKDLGDEPFQFFNKFGKTVQVAVDRDRVNGINQLLKLGAQPELVLLDDAYQHRSVKAGFYIMLTTYANPFFEDIVLPTGDLREPRSGYKRADVIVVTKCPSTLQPEEKELYISAIAPLKHQSVFFSTITYSETIISNTKEIALDSLGEFCLVTGIANAEPLVAFLSAKALTFEHLNYKDHHDFSQTDIAVLERKAVILTTEKDYMRLKSYKQLEAKLFYLPIAVALDAPSLFHKQVTSFVKTTLNRR